MACAVSGRVEEEAVEDEAELDDEDDEAAAEARQGSVASLLDT